MLVNEQEQPGWIVGVSLCVQQIVNGLNARQLNGLISFA